MKRNKKTLLIGLIFSLPMLASAQSFDFFSKYRMEIVLGTALLVCFVALLAVMVSLYAVRALLADKMKGKEEVFALIAARPGEEKIGFWGRLWNRLNDAVPIEKEASVATDHEYDGIRELDNRLPPWWLYGFYFTIVFGLVYLVYYHVGNGPSQAEEYNREMEKARAILASRVTDAGASVDENSVTLLTEVAEIETGKKIYLGNCAMCHGQEGEGGIGPNLTDKYWIHGGNIQDIFKVIKYGGNKGKGMIAWEKQLKAEDIQRVSSFIYTLEGTKPANAKEPEGELFERTEPSETPADAADATES
jgi:cytochrome c oxidase cbb3-type subunit III